VSSEPASASTTTISVSPTQNANANQFSPRVRLSFFPDPSTTIWAYYGRLFLPTNTEDLRAITSAGQGGVALQPTVPERDHFFEVGLTHRFPFGLVAKLSAYHKRSSPGIDDTQVPGTAITTDVNIEQVRITGLDRAGSAPAGYRSNWDEDARGGEMVAFFGDAAGPAFDLTTTSGCRGRRASPAAVKASVTLRDLRRPATHGVRRIPRRASTTSRRFRCWHRSA
jgi:outer membrane receptor protein involved in Fe transport